MANKQIYRGMSIDEGVAHVEHNYSATDLKNVNSFSDLHELNDANMSLPFPDDCGDSTWMEFANAVIEAFNQKYQTGADE